MSEQEKEAKNEVGSMTFPSPEPHVVSHLEAMIFAHGGPNDIIVVGSMTFPSPEPHVVSHLEAMIFAHGGPNDIIVGLNFIREIKDEKGYLYNCSLSGTVCRTNDIMIHLYLELHKVKYLEKMQSLGYSNGINEIINMPLDDSAKEVRINEECKGMLRVFGQGRPVVVVRENLELEARPVSPAPVSPAPVSPAPPDESVDDESLDEPANGGFVQCHLCMAPYHNLPTLRYISKCDILLCYECYLKIARSSSICPGCVEKKNFNKHFRKLPVSESDSD